MPDGCYLMNCTIAGDVRSGVAYYKDIQFGGGNDGQKPDDFMYISFGKFQKWEGDEAATTFPSGVTVSWRIQGSPETNAGLPVGTILGFGGNGFENWQVYKDANTIMFTDNNGYQCSKVYMLAP